MSSHQRELLDQLSWCVITLHRGEDCELVQGDPELVFGVTSSDFALRGLAGRIVGEEPEPCPWRETCASSVYLIRQSTGEAQWVESRSMTTEEGELIVSTRASGPGNTLQQLAALGRVALASSLLGPLAHEVNNVVQGLTAATYLLEDWITHGEPIAPEFAQDVNGVVETLANIGSSLQAFTRQSALPPEPLSVVELVESCAELLRRSGKLSVVEFTLNSIGPLPHLTWSKTELEYVVLALLCNAAEAAQKTPTEHAIRVELSSNATEVLLEIHDTGDGLGYAKAIRPHTSDGPADSSMGLGLSIASTLLASRGGTIAAARTPRGSVVRVGLLIAPQRSQ